LKKVKWETEVFEFVFWLIVILAFSYWCLHNLKGE